MLKKIKDVSTLPLSFPGNEIEMLTATKKVLNIPSKKTLSTFQDINLKLKQYCIFALYMHKHHCILA